MRVPQNMRAVYDRLEKNLPSVLKSHKNIKIAMNISQASTLILEMMQRGRGRTTVKARGFTNHWKDHQRKSENGISCSFTKDSYSYWRKGGKLIRKEEWNRWKSGNSSLRFRSKSHHAERQSRSMTTKSDSTIRIWKDTTKGYTGIMPELTNLILFYHFLHWSQFPTMFINIRLSIFIRYFNVNL